MKFSFKHLSVTVARVSLYACIFFGFITHAHAAPADSISASPMQYHKVTLDWNGPSVNESNGTFNNFRLNVTFTSPSGQTFLVPGYFAADGDAAQTSATSGNQWRAHINPQETGVWSYEVSFRAGNNVAISLNQNAGRPVANSFDGSRGSFNVVATNKSGVDFRGKGKLQYVDEHFLQFTNGEYFLKVGPNAPEVFLEYNDFDGTDSNRSYSSHAGDFNQGDPDWGNNRGREIIGVVNYLSNIGMNVHYFLTMNIRGDGRRAYPFIEDDRPNIYDVSKLAQWQIVFDHMMEKGLMAHFVMTETENESWFEHTADPSGGNTFANTRRLYYREMVARFGYLNAITWNIGEENGWATTNSGNVGRPTTTSQRLAYAQYLDDINPYEDQLVIHNNPTVRIHEDIVDDITSYNGASFQIGLNNGNASRSRLKALVNRSAASASRKWVVSFDEPFTSSRDPGVALFRENAIWNTFMLGGAGVEFYIGGGADQRVENYREFSEYWLALDIARDFFIDNNIPFWRMSDADNQTDRGFALAEDSGVYVVYLPNGGAPSVNIPGTGTYEVFWYNPRTGGNLQNGSVVQVNASNGNGVSLGNPPSSNGSEWVVVARNTNNVPSNSPPTVSVVLPTNGQSFTVGDTISIEAIASDVGGAIDNVVFFVNGEQIAIQRVPAYRASFLTTEPGNLVIEARTTDNSGNTRSARISVSVNAPLVLRDADVPASAVTQGLNFQYFEINGLNNLNVLDDLNGTPTREGSQTSGLSFAPRTNNNDNFGFIFNGFINAPRDGEYTFTLNSNDGSDIQIGDTVVVSYDGQHTASDPMTGSIGLEAGLHRFQLRYFQSGGEFSLTPSWQGPGFTQIVIPDSAFRHERSGPPFVDSTPRINVIAPIVTLLLNSNETGVNDTPPIGTPPIDTPPVSSGAFIERDGLIVVEMESLDAPSGWVEQSGDGAIGSYLEWTNSNNSNNPGIATISMNVVISNPGTYQFLWRSSIREGTNTTESNDSWLRVLADNFYGFRARDNSTVCPRNQPASNRCTGRRPAGSTNDGWFKIYRSGGPASDWLWSTLTSDSDAHSIYADFDRAGEYEIEISARSQNHAIDRFVLFRSLNDTNNVSENFANDRARPESNRAP